MDRRKRVSNEVAITDGQPSAVDTGDISPPDIKSNEPLPAYNKYQVPTSKKLDAPNRSNNDNGNKTVGTCDALATHTATDDKKTSGASTVTQGIPSANTIPIRDPQPTDSATEEARPNSAAIEVTQLNDVTIDGLQLTALALEEFESNVSFEELRPVPENIKDHHPITSSIDRPYPDSPTTKYATPRSSESFGELKPVPENIKNHHPITSSIDRPYPDSSTTKYATPSTIAEENIQLTPAASKQVSHLTTILAEDPQIVPLAYEGPFSTSIVADGRESLILAFENPIATIEGTQNPELPDDSQRVIGNAMNPLHPLIKMHHCWPAIDIEEVSEVEGQKGTTGKPKMENHRSSSAESAVIRTALGVKAHLKDYCSSTAIHGVRYFADDGQHCIEKIFWAVAIVFLMVGCFNRMKLAWNKWETSPVIVTFAEYPTSTADVPFPAVTICPETKSRQTVFNFTEMYFRHYDFNRTLHLSHSDNRTQHLTKLNHEELNKLEAVSLLCENQVYDSQLLLSHGGSHVRDDTLEDLKKLAPELQYAMSFCQWQGVAVNCSDIFEPVWSDEGVCYTFNLISNIFTKAAVQNTKPDTSNKMDDESHLFHALHAGVQAGLLVQLRSNESDFDYLCRGVQGFKVLLHNSAEVPLVGQQYIRVPGSQDVVAVVKPMMINTSDGLYGYAPRRRQCYFPTERQLQFFRVYTQKNCELECLTNATLKHCGCVSFYMPRSKQTPICGPGKRNCTQKANENYLIGKGTQKLSLQIPEERGTLRAVECDCLASCVSLEYNAETSQAQFNHWNDPANLGNTSDQLKPGLLLSQISIFFKDLQFITIRRREVYGQTDLIATIGGLLNLFSGFSVLSLLEVLYFLTFRLWSRLKSRGGADEVHPAT